MTVSQLIIELQNVIKDHGDIEVHISGDDEDLQIKGLALLELDDGKIDSVTICDHDTYDGYAGG